MAKKITGYIKLQLPAGKANPSPPVGPALGQHGVNIMQFCKDFNAKTTMANAANAANNLAYQGQLASFGAQQTNSAMPLALASSLVTGATKFGQSSGAFSGWANTNSQASSQYYYG